MLITHHTDTSASAASNVATAAPAPGVTLAAAPCWYVCFDEDEDGDAEAEKRAPEKPGVQDAPEHVAPLTPNWNQCMAVKRN